MSRPAPRSIDEYLKQLRAALKGEGRLFEAMHAHMAKPLLVTHAM